MFLASGGRRAGRLLSVPQGTGRPTSESHPAPDASGAKVERPECKARNAFLKVHAWPQLCTPEIHMK